MERTGTLTFHKHPIPEWSRDMSSEMIRNESPCFAMEAAKEPRSIARTGFWRIVSRRDECQEPLFCEVRSCWQGGRDRQFRKGNVSQGAALHLYGVVVTRHVSSISAEQGGGSGWL